MNNQDDFLGKDIALRVANLKNKMLKLELANPNFIKGCSQEEIVKLQKEYDVIFPHSYKVFLENFGHGLGGKVMNDIDILYDQVFPLTNIARNQILIEKAG